MNPPTEQEIDAEVSRYEPFRNRDGLFIWVTNPPSRPDLDALAYRVPSHFFARLVPKLISDDCGCKFRIYPTREAAFADLRNAIRSADGVQHPQEVES